MTIKKAAKWALIGAAVGAVMPFFYLGNNIAVGTKITSYTYKKTP